MRLNSPHVRVVAGGEFNRDMNYLPVVFIARRRFISAHIRGAAQRTILIKRVERSSFDSIVILLTLTSIQSLANRSGNADYNLRLSKFYKSIRKTPSLHVQLGVFRICTSDYSSMLRILRLKRPRSSIPTSLTLRI